MDFLHPLRLSHTRTGRARMLREGSSPSAPVAWLQRVPHPPDGASGRPPCMPSSPFVRLLPATRFLDYAAALALDLLVCPPALRLQFRTYVTDVMCAGRYRDSGHASHTSPCQPCRMDDAVMCDATAAHHHHRCRGAACWSCGSCVIWMRMRAPEDAVWTDARCGQVLCYGSGASVKSYIVCLI